RGASDSLRDSLRTTCSGFAWQRGPRMSTNERADDFAAIARNTPHPRSSQLNMNSTVALLAGWYYPDSVGGTEAFVRTLALDLRSLGYTVHVAAPAATGGSSSYEIDGIAVYRYPVALAATSAEAQSMTPPTGLDVFRNWL